MRKYYCPHCDVIDADTATVVDHESSEFWGARATHAVEFVICAQCGEDVEEVADSFTVETEEEE